MKNGFASSECRSSPCSWISRNVSWSCRGKARARDCRASALRLEVLLSGSGPLGGLARTGGLRATASSS
eukprot:3303248-Pyramimonas_sp.AAC.1